MNRLNKLKDDLAEWEHWDRCWRRVLDDPAIVDRYKERARLCLEITEVNIKRLNRKITELEDCEHPNAERDGDTRECSDCGKVW